MSISLLSLLVGHNGPAIVGLDLRPVIFLYIKIFVFLRLFFFICLDMGIFDSPSKLVKKSFSFLVSDLLCILKNFVIFDILLSTFVSISL